MPKRDVWTQYVDAMRAHLAHNERLAERMRYFAGDAMAPPVHASAADLRTWLALLHESESVAQNHRKAFESYLDHR